jgi:hypothetical protein
MKKAKKAFFLWPVAEFLNSFKESELSFSLLVENGAFL